jgi:hypothetical protein
MAAHSLLISHLVKVTCLQNKLMRRRQELEDIISDVYIGEATSLLENTKTKFNNSVQDTKELNKEIATILIVDDNADMRATSSILT